MYTTMLAYSYFLPLTTLTATGNRKTKLAIFLFCLGPLLGWPFVGLLALPFIVEQLALPSGDVVKAGEIGEWLVGRVKRLVLAGVVCVVGISVSGGTGCVPIYVNSYSKYTSCYRFPPSWSIPGRTVDSSSLTSTLFSTTSFHTLVETPTYMAPNLPISISKTSF